MIIFNRGIPRSGMIWTFNVFRFDRVHLVTGRHVQSGKSGRWREELTTFQQQTINDRFESLVKLLGFDS